MKKVLIYCGFILLLILFVYPQSKEELNKQLFEAVKSGNLEQVKVLVEIGADVNCKDEDNITILMEAIFRGDFYIVKALTENGADWEASSPKYGWPVVLAIMNNDKRIIDYYLSLGYNINRKDKQGRSLLYWAIRNNNEMITRYLISKGADVNQPHKGDATLFWDAVYKGNLDIIKVLVENGAVWDKAIPQYGFPVVVAILKGDVKQVELFLSLGFDLNKGDVEGKTLLHWAVQYNKPNIVEFLVSKGADVNAWDHNGMPPIFDAIANGYSHIEKYLLDHGAVKEKLKIDQADQWYIKGNEAFRQKKYIQAIDYYNKALRIKPGKAIYIKKLAQSFRKAGLFIEGEKILQSSLSKFNHQETKKMIYGELARTYHARAANLKTKNRYMEAIKYYQKSYEIKKKYNVEDAGIDLIGIGFSYKKIFQYEKVIEYCQKALKLALEINDGLIEGAALSGLGQAYSAIGKNEKAFEYYGQALTVFREQNFPNGEAETLNLMGIVSYQIGGYKMAIFYLQDAMKIFQKVNNQSRMASVRAALGAVYHGVGKYQKALSLIKESLLIHSRIGNRNGEVSCLNKLGVVYSTLNMNHKAIKCYHQALTIARERGDRQQEGYILLNLGMENRILGRYDVALRYYQEAIRICKQIGDLYFMAVALNNQGRIYDLLKRYDESIDSLKKSIDISRKVGLLSLEAIACNSLGSVYFYNKGNLEKAVIELEKSVKLDDYIRFEIENAEFKKSYFDSYLENHKFLFTLYCEKRDYKRAFETAEKSKSVIFSEMMAKRGARQITAKLFPDFQKELQKEIQLLQQIYKVKSRIKKESGSAQKELSRMLSDLNRRLLLMRVKMKGEFPLYVKFHYPDTIRLEEIQAFLKENETYVSFYLFKEYSIAFIIIKHDFAVIKLDAGDEWLKEKISKIRTSLAVLPGAIRKISKQDKKRFSALFSIYSSYHRNSNELYLKILKPLENYINTKKILISADGVLYGFPFEALVTKVTDSFQYKHNRFSINHMALKQFSMDIPLFYEFTQMKYLGEKYSISYIPSASTLNVLRGELSRKRESGEGVIAFADPIFSKNQVKYKNGKVANPKGLIEGELYVKRRAVREWPPDRLPETAEEAEIFKDQIGKGKLYTGLEATEENVWKANLEKAKYILFSTHGILGKEAESKDITEPALVLTLINNPDEYDGLLGMTEVAGLRLNSDVVILSACNSAGESGKGGEGFAGMARSFLFAGSQAVVASHWQVDTRATKMLIENYGKFLKTKGRLEALEEARNVVKNAVVEYGKDRKIKVSYAHPYFWAAFVLLGER